MKDVHIPSVNLLPLPLQVKSTTLHERVIFIGCCGFIVFFAVGSLHFYYGKCANQTRQKLQKQRLETTHNPQREKRLFLQNEMAAVEAVKDNHQRLLRILSQVALNLSADILVREIQIFPAKMILKGEAFGVDGITYLMRALKRQADINQVHLKQLGRRIKNTAAKSMRKPLPFELIVQLRDCYQ